MKTFCHIQRITVALAVVNLVLPVHRVLADAPAASLKPAGTPMVLTRDVSLGSSRQLRGQLVNSEGQPLAGQIVVAARGEERPMQTTTDVTGRFAFAGLSAGVYRVQTVDSFAVCRCWANNTAPPAAVEQVLLVAGDDTVRAQNSMGELLTGPVLLGLILAAAIAIPIALYEADDSGS
jgi:hypothetical protein